MNLGDLRGLGPPTAEVLDEEVHVNKIDEEPLPIIGGPEYRFYPDWKDRGYYSDQFKSKLQNSVAGSEKYLSINDQGTSFDTTNIPLKTYDIEKDTLDDFTMVFIGRRRSGKSWMARWVIYHLRHRYPCGIVITGTQLNNFWAQYVPKEFIHSVKDMNMVLDNVFQRQTFLKQHPELGIDPRMFVILDDVMGDKYRVRFSKQLSTAFTDGRHYGILTLITTQDPMGIPPALRENTDVAFCFRQFTHNRKEALSRNYLSYISDKNDRLQFLWNKTKRINPDGSILDQEKSTEEQRLDLLFPILPLPVCLLFVLTNSLKVPAS